MNIAERLFAEGCAFDFFQAVRVLARLDPARRPVGRAGPPRDEVVRFGAHLALTFPASAIDEVRPPTPDLPVPLMTVTFFGLTGPSGILPRHYTEYLMRQEREGKGEEKSAFRAWLDLFNHRLISLFYRAWEKYRFYLAYERGAYDRPEPDPFTRALFSLVGLGMPPLRDRLRVACRHEAGWHGQLAARGTGERVLARIDDLSLLYYGGLLAQRPRSAAGLQALLEDFFRLPVQVNQFHGRWLAFDEAGRSRLGEANCGLGVDLTAGEQVYDVQSKVRLRIGPLPRARFDALLPDRAPTPERKALFLLAQLTRLYLGPELDFDVQVVLRAADVPPCRIPPTLPSPTRGEDARLSPSPTRGEDSRLSPSPRVGEGRVGGEPRLGWNTWLCTHTVEQDADDAVFEGEEVYWIDGKG